MASPRSEFGSDEQAEAAGVATPVTIAPTGPQTLTLASFFFSSRRRHTRLTGDWSSDVCSSDLEDEGDLRAAVRALLEDRCGWAAVLARTESGEPYDAGLWHALAADIGCAGLLVPQQRGGAGASYRETAVAAEELGRSVAPVPFLGSAVVATTALLAAAAGELLSRLAEGGATAALA